MIVVVDEALNILISRLLLLRIHYSDTMIIRLPMQFLIRTNQIIAIHNQDAPFLPLHIIHA